MFFAYLLIGSNKQKESGVIIQAATAQNVLRLVSDLIVILPLQTISDEERKNKRTDLNQSIYKELAIFEFIGSSRIKKWLLDVKSSNIGNLPGMIWITESNIDKLIHIINLELKTYSMIDRIRHSLKIWLK